MFCPTCNSTFLDIGCCSLTEGPIRWCARCGTIQTCDHDPVPPADAYIKYHATETPEAVPA